MFQLPSCVVCGTLWKRTDLYPHVYGLLAENLHGPMSERKQTSELVHLNVSKLQMLPS